METIRNLIEIVANSTEIVRNSTLIQLFIFLYGLVFGSFFNVAILRPLSNESIISPPSKCPKCNHKLAWYDNIPLFSYIILGARCRYCKKFIHWQYPLVEFITGFLFWASVMTFGLTIKCFFMLVAISYFIIMSGTDFREQIVFTIHTKQFIAFGILYGAITGITSNGQLIPIIVDSFGGLLVGVLIMELIARSGYLFVKKRAFGEGDTYIIAGIGAFLGIKGVLVTLVFAVLIQTLWAIPMLIKKYIDNKKYSEVVTLFVFAFIIASYCYLDKIGGFETMWLYYMYLALIFAYAYKTCKELINSAKLEGGGIYLPFGPALFMGALIVMFFFPQFTF